MSTRLDFESAWLTVVLYGKTEAQTSRKMFIGSSKLHKQKS
uniref:Uncharacterized protein n=1 Tax=Arundo donax TaxID=35708 RepID=A0A0A8YMN7_ARUDO